MDRVLGTCCNSSTAHLKQAARCTSCGAFRHRLTGPFRSSKPQAVRRQSSLRCRAAAETENEQKDSGAQSSAQDKASGNFVPVCKPEEVPKGFRKEVVVDGVEIMLFWYKNQVYAIEARSPAEGAYSEGFMNARLNQEYCIACPSTGTLFSFQTGEIKDWYPANPVLRAITPQSTCRNLDIFPVRLTQEAIAVDVSGASVRALSAAGKGGSDSSIDLNNVFGVEARPYYENQNPVTGEYDTEAANKVNPYVISVSLFAIVFAGVAGSAFALYKESYIGLGLLWILILAVAVYALRTYTPLGNKD